MSTLLKAPTICSSGSEQQEVFPASIFGEPQQIRLYEPSDRNDEAEDFLDAALKLYEERGDLLLGWFSRETQDFDLLPEELPPAAVQWIVVSSGAEVPHNPRGSVHTIEDEECCDNPEEVSVTVSGVGPGRAALEAALQEFPAVKLLPEEEWSSASTLVMTTAGMHLSHVIGAHYVRAHLTEDADNTSDSERIRFVTDVHHGQGQRTLNQSSSSSDVVSKSTIVPAVGAAILDHHCYAIWRRLASSHNVVGVRVLRDCTYGEAFRELLLKQRLLPVGVKLIPEDECAIANPPAALRLTSSALLLCFVITLHVDTSALPSVTISQGIQPSATSSYHF